MTARSRVDALQFVVQHPLRLRPDLALATVLIDGVDVAGQLEHLFHGSDPSTMLVRPSPLSPPDRLQRVAVGVWEEAELARVAADRHQEAPPRTMS